MCVRMVDIISAAAEIRRGKKKKPQGKNIMVCPIPCGDHNKWSLSLTQRRNTTTLRVDDGEIDAGRVEELRQRVDVRTTVTGGVVDGGTERPSRLVVVVAAAAGLVDLRVHCRTAVHQQLHQARLVGQRRQRQRRL